MIVPTIVHAGNLQRAKKVDCALDARVGLIRIVCMADGVPLYKAALNQRLLSGDGFL